MEPRQKKLVFALGVVPFLVLYMGLALWIWDQLPANKLVEFVFFVAAGTLWAFPLKPFMRWMNRPTGDA